MLKIRCFSLLPILMTSTMLAGCASPADHTADLAKVAPEPARQAAEVPADRSNLPLNQRPIAYVPEGAERVKVQQDIPYKLVDGKELKFDVYTPETKPAGKLPVVIFVHGDAPQSVLNGAKDWGQYSSWARAVAASGMAAVTFDHRSTEELTQLTEAGADVDDLISYVRERANEYDLDPERIVIWSCSAGAPLGLRTALRDRPIYIKGVIAYYPLLDIQDRRDELSDAVTDDILRDFSPVTHLSPDPQQLPPLLLVKAGRDSAAINDPLTRFYNEAKSLQAPLTYLEHPTAPHAFDILNDDATTRAIITQTLNFAKNHLATK